MSNKLGFIQRYLIVIRKIKNHPYISKDELVRQVQDELTLHGIDDVGIGQRTIERDLKEIRNNIGISVEYSKPRKGYFIPDDEDNRTELEELLEPFEMLCTLGADMGLDSVVFQEKRKPRGTEHLSGLIHAIRQSRVVSFDYRKFDNDRMVNRRVKPYALKEFRRRWYLLSVEQKERGRGGNMVKAFGLDRMSNVKVAPEKFKKDRNIDIQKQYKDCFGIYSDDDKQAEEVILSLSPLNGRYNDAFPLHPSQETIVENDKEIRIRLKIKITEDFVRELLSQSPEIRVISPGSLRKELCRLYNQGLWENREID